jgi:hypothetical protein
MYFSKFLIVMLFICLFTYPLYAAGSFQIGEDEGGVYFQTDNHGGWYIDKNDLKKFKIGETGNYFIKTDRNRTYIIAERHGKFYLDLEAKKHLEKEIQRFNSEQQEKSQKLKDEETQRKELETKKNDKQETDEDVAETKEIKITITNEYRHPFGIWGSPYGYGRYGKIIHHKIRSPNWINKPATAKYHPKRIPPPYHHRNIHFKMHSGIKH